MRCALVTGVQTCALPISSHLLHPGVRDPKTEQSVLWLSTRLEQYPTLLMLPADLDAHMATRSTTSTPTSWPAWAQRRSALCRRALSSDTASRSDKPEQRRRRCVAADRPAQLVSSSHPVVLSLVDNRDRGPLRLPLQQT